MAKARIITYECEECGSEIIVTPTGETALSPIYCCGIEVTEISSAQKKPSKPAKKIASKTTTKKVTKKKVAAKKKPSAKKKTAKR
jgi:BRCT domain type II-containing protein